MVGLKTKEKKGLKSVHFKKTVMQSSFLSKVGIDGMETFRGQ